MHAPVFDDKMPAELAVRDGESLALRCQVRGDPDPKTTWSKNGEPLSSSDVVDLKFRNNVASLVIGEVFPEDEGLYECRAYNSMGEVITTCKVTVTRKWRRAGDGWGGGGRREAQLDWVGGVIPGLDTSIPGLEWSLARGMGFLERGVLE